MVGKRVLRKARFREILRNYKSFLSIILIAVLCVALFTGLFANYKNFDIKVKTFYKETNMADYFVTTTKYDNDDFENLKENIKDIKEIEKRIYLPLQYANKTFSLIAVEDNAKISKPKIIEGKEGVLVSKTFMDSMNAHIGDTFILTFSINFEKAALSTLPGEINYLAQDQMPISFTIDGIMQHPEDIEKNSLYSGQIYMTQATFIEGIHTVIENSYHEIIVPNLKEEIKRESFLNQFVITSKKDIQEDINQYFIQKENSNLLSCLARDSFPTNSSIEMDVKQAKQLLFVFPMVFYLVGVLVIVTSLKELIHKERKNIGLLSALGFSKIEIILHYSYISIILVSIGALIGTIIGPAIIPGIMGRKYNILYNLPKTSLPFAYIEYFYCFIILVIISIVACVFVSFNEVNRNPAVILRNDNKKSLKSSKFKTNKGILPLKMSFRSMRLNLVRSFMVLIGVLGCSALLVCGFGIDDTLNHSVDVETKDLVCYDINVTYKTELELNQDKIKNEDKYEKQSIIALNKGKSYNTSLFVFQKQPTIFKPFIPDKGCMISKRLSEDLKIKKGDTITYILHNESLEIEVVAIQELSFTSGIFILDDACTPNASYIVLNEEESIKDYKEELLSLGATSVMTKEELEETAVNLLSGIRGITFTVKVFAVLLALVVIYNLAQLNYKERLRDIATLKVLGFGKLEIAQTLLYEITTLTLIGSIIGMFLGKPLLILLLKINQTSRFTYIYYIHFSSYLIAVLLTLVISIIINLFITKLSDRIQMVESLKSVE